MGTPVGYRALYQVLAKGVDLKSGKAVTNAYFMRSGFPAAGPPAYDTPIPGSDLATVLTNFDTRWGGQLLPLMSENYQQTSYLIRKIIGWKYGSPFYPIIGVTATLTGTAFTVAGVLPLLTPFFGNIAGLIGASAANGIWTISPTSLNQFTTTANIVGDPWISGGTLQKIGTSEGWYFSDLASLTVTAIGGVAGDALPLFSDVSARRLGSTAGKMWQGRNSYAPIAESDQKNGKLEAAALTAWNTALPIFAAPILNGGTTGDDRDKMFFYNASFKKALSIPTPWTTEGPADQSTSLVSSMFAQPNLGSLTKRKPRLTSVIS